MRQDILFVHPDDFKKAYKMFKKWFTFWGDGYEKWGSQEFSVIFVRDTSVSRGYMVGCLGGDPDMYVNIKIA